MLDLLLGLMLFAIWFLSIKNVIKYLLRLVWSVIHTQEVALGRKSREVSRLVRKEQNASLYRLVFAILCAMISGSYLVGFIDVMLFGM